MAWSYTHGAGECYRTDGGFYSRWWNNWSVTELAPVTANKIRLRVSLTTTGYSQNGAYVWYADDSLVCGSTRVAVLDGYVVHRDAGYTIDVEVPGSWSGQTITMYVGWWTVTTTLNATVALPSAITAEDGFFGRGVPITVTPSLSGTRHTLTVSCAGRSETLLTRDEAATAVTWTPATAIYAPLLPNAASAAATLSCETFYGEASMGSTSLTITLRFESGSLSPQLTAGWAAASVYNEGAAASFQSWIQGVSRAELHFDGTKVACRYGASVAGYSVSCEGLTVSQSPWRTGVLPETSAALVCTVTDSRGQTASETLQLTLSAYAPPVIQGASFARCDAQGVETDDGVCLAASATALISSLNGENSAVLSLRSRALTGSFGAASTLSSGQRTVVSGFSPDVSYELELTLTDALGSSARLLQTLPTRRWAMKFRADGGGVAFGKAAESDAALELASGWALLLHGPNGESARLDYTALTALLGLLSGE